MFRGLKNYLSKRITLIKYKGIELIVSILTTILAEFLFLLFCILTMVLGSIVLALWIGYHYNSYTLIFGIMTGMYALLAVVSLVFRKTLLDRFLKDFLTRSVFRKSGMENE
ncbi:MAG: hypothetical protein ABI045_02830 [Flavobacteriales bacterium]